LDTEPVQSRQPSDSRKKVILALKCVGWAVLAVLATAASFGMLYFPIVVAALIVGVLAKSPNVRWPAFSVAGSLVAINGIVMLTTFRLS
jgi:hypothetical protein